MHRALGFILLLLLGATLACGGSEPDGDAAAQATIQAAIASVNATLEASRADPEPPTPNPSPVAAPSGSVPASPATKPTSADRGSRRDFRSLDNAEYLLQSEPQAATAIAELPWVADGVAGDELETAEHLTQLAAFHQPIFWSLVGHSWLRDQLADSEASVVKSVLIITQRNSDAAYRVVGLPWLADAVAGREMSAVEDLALIAQSDADAALRIAAMSFLESLDAPDVAALRSLHQLAFINPRVFRQVLAHPTLNGGITDEWAPIVAILNGVGRTNPALIDTLLDPDQVTVESRAIDLPLSGTVILAIIRTGLGAGRSMDLLETAVRNAEEFMDAPLPTGYVGLLYELAVDGSSAGVNFGAGIAIRPKFDVADGSHEADSAGHIIAHEVAHYYWNNNADWIDEGASELMASASELARVGRPLDAANYPCGYVPNLAALESLEVAHESAAFVCNYSLGERIFLDLYRNLGDAAFRQGFRDLYRRSMVEDDADDLPGTLVGVDELRAAFRAAADGGTVEAIIARWYDGTETFDTDRLDFTSVDADLTGIDGRIDRSYVSVAEQGQPTEQFSAQDLRGPVFLNLEYSYRITGDAEDVHLQIVESYQDGFTFRRRNTTITAQPGYRGGKQWLQIGPPSGEPWAIGWHQAQVYEGSRKVAEAQYVVTP